MAELTDANENPWYVLMTLYGEQDGEKVDWDLHAKNRAAWNAWACQGLDDAMRAILTDAKAEVPEDGAWGAMEEAVRAALAERKPDLSYEDLPDVGSLIDLSEISFSNTVVLEKLIFTQATSFGSATFTRAADFTSAIFTQAASFDSATFTRDAYFISATFTQAANFTSAIFTQAASFDSATFTRDAYFISATFTQAASFISATFTQDAIFISAIFTQEALFRSATFTQVASFISATFTRAANFISAIFAQRAYFNSATFTHPAYFTKAKFGDPDNPKPALLNLVDVQFERPASFREAEFLNWYPDLTGAIVHEKTLWPWKPENWPEQTNQDPEKGRDSCAALRHHLSRQGLPEAELFFFKREMGFAGRIGTWWERLPYRFYGWSSDYGSSIVKPCYGLLAIWLVPALIYMVVFAWREAMGGRNYGPLEPFGFSFSNIFKFFGLQRTYFNDTIETLGPWLETLAASQTVLGFMALFFLGLGLRQRFRLR